MRRGPRPVGIGRAAFEQGEADLEETTQGPQKRAPVCPVLSPRPGEKKPMSRLARAQVSAEDFRYRGEGNFALKPAGEIALEATEKEILVEQCDAEAEALRASLADDFRRLSQDRDLALRKKEQIRIVEGQNKGRLPKMIADEERANKKAESCWRAKYKPLEAKETELSGVVNDLNQVVERMRSDNKSLREKIEDLERSQSPGGARPKPRGLTWRQFANELAFEQKELVDQIMAVGFFRQREAVKGTVKF